MNPRIDLFTPSETFDLVERPAHYNQGGIEVIDAIRAWGLNFELGNVLKYIARAGKKDPAKTVEDLRKAMRYLELEIERVEINAVPTDIPNGVRMARIEALGGRL